MGNRFSVFSRFWKFLRRVFKYPRNRKESHQATEDVPLPDVTEVSEPDAQPVAALNEGDHEKENCIETVRQGDSLHHTRAYGLDDSIIGLAPPHQRTGSTSSYSGDESEDDPTKASARKQLISIPEPSEPPGESPETGYQEPPKDPPPRPLQLPDLIERVSPHSVFNYLPIEDVLAAGKVDRQLRAIVDNYFLHYILPQTEISYYLAHVVDDHSPPEEEYQRLYPVIRRIEKEKRVFPDNRVVYEPKLAKKPQYTYRKDTFNHIEIRFELGDSRQSKEWPLHCPPEHLKYYSYTADGYRTKKVRFRLQHTRMFQFMRFDTFENSPIYVFYKDVPDTNEKIVSLHAISIPLNFLRQSLSDEIKQHQ